MALNPREARDGVQTPWGALTPALVLLGISLPLIFLAKSEQYLYYLQPIELLPTYATAWLLLALLCIPPVVVAALALRLFERLRLQRAAAVLGFLLLAAAATAAIVAILLAVVIWVATFSSIPRAAFEAGAETELSLAALLLGLVAAFTPWGRRTVGRLRLPALALTLLGALSVLSLPFFGWQSGPPTDANAQAASNQSSGDAPGRPHIVLLTIDALSAGQMSLYGDARPTTPNLDAFASTASVFEHAYANANFTTAAVASILTSTRPWTHGAYQIFSWPNIETRQRSLPEELAREGYLTGYVATNSYAGAARLGFAPYFRFGSSDQVPMTLPCPDRLARLLPYECPASQVLPLLLAQKLWSRTRLASLSRTNRHYDPELAVQSALEFLAHADTSRPVFLWVHLFPPHAPYAAPRPWLGQFSASRAARDPAGSDPEDNFMFREIDPELVSVLEARYDEAVRYVDHYAGQFITQALHRLGDNTVIVVMADHGESFGNGYGGHGGPGLYDSIIHVPLIIKLPYQTRPMRIETRAEQIDIAPTLAALAQITPPSSWEGRSLLPLWDTAAEQIAATPPIFAMNFEENRRDAPLTTGSVAVLDGRWKLLHYMGRLHYEHIPRLHDELYDIVADPGELTDLAAQEPQQVQLLSTLAAQELARHGGLGR